MTGVPFKYSRTNKHHTSFVHSVAYSSNGSLFASAGADRKIYLYDGSSGDQTISLAGHEGSIFAVGFSSDSKSLASASADGTVRLWDPESQKKTKKWDLGKGSGLEGQQVGLCWVGETIVSVSSTGELSLIDSREDKVSRVLSVSVCVRERTLKADGLCRAVSCSL